MATHNMASEDYVDNQIAELDATFVKADDITLSGETALDAGTLSLREVSAALKIVWQKLGGTTND